MQPPLHVVLDRPAIAGNVGAVARLCAATGAALHVCGAIFDASDRKMWRAGLDYWPEAHVHFHLSLERCLALVTPDAPSKTPWILEVGATLAPWDVALARGSVVVLGPENDSVDHVLMEKLPERVLTLPTREGIRSLNLAQCAAVIVFEALRQQRTERGASPRPTF
jgi:tRNA (cytidine/uridine-2'-O-)-methyltransferase